MTSRWMSFWLTCGLCHGVACSAGSAREPQGLWTGAIDAPVPATLQGARVIQAARVAGLLRHAVVVDVSNAPRRPPELAPGAPWLPLPHRALPGALWLPGVGEGELTPTLEADYRARLEAATAGNRDVPLIVYCHTHCWLSWNAAKRAVGYGYRQVYWFPGGIEAWTAAGHATVTVQAQGEVAAAAPSLAVLDLELTGDLGGPEFTAAHEQRLRVESERLREDLRRTGRYRLLDLGPAKATIDRLRSQQAYLHDCNGCDLDIGKELGADSTMVAWVDRVSGLILSLTYEIHDVATGQITARKSFDFRGDNDNAWNHAVDYLVKDLQRSAAITPEVPGAR